MNTRAYFLAMLVPTLLAAGCADTTNATAEISGKHVTPAAFNVAGAPTVAFNVPDMMCPEGCGEKTKAILSEQPGAKEVVINFEAKTATVAVEDGKFDAEAAIAALVDHGFEHSTLKSDGAGGDAAADAPAKPAG